MIKKKNNSTSQSNSTQNMTVVAEINAELSLQPVKVDPDKFMPLLALRNMVLFPNVVLPVNVGRKKSLRAAEVSFRDQKPVVVFCQRDSQVDNPGFDDLYPTGVVARVLRVF
jgi:ATP-dependent Lon protease